MTQSQCLVRLKIIVMISSHVIFRSQFRDIFGVVLKGKSGDNLHIFFPWIPIKSSNQNYSKLLKILTRAPNVYKSAASNSPPEMLFTHQFKQHSPRKVPGCFKRTKRLLKRKEVLMYSLPCSCNVTFSVGTNGLCATRSVGSWEEHIFGFGMSCWLGEKYKQQHHNQRVRLKIPNCNIYAVCLFTRTLRVSSGYKKK